MLSFEWLCGRPVAADDYLAIAHKFHTVAVSDVPVFTAANRREGERERNIAL